MGSPSWKLLLLLAFLLARVGANFEPAHVQAGNSTVVADETRAGVDNSITAPFDWTKLEKMIASLAQDISLLQHGQEALRLDMHGGQEALRLDLQDVQRGQAALRLDVQALEQREPPGLWWSLAMAAGVVVLVVWGLTPSPTRHEILHMLAIEATKSFSAVREAATINRLREIAAYIALLYLVPNFFNIKQLLGSA